jgi:hypothetical protein
MRVEEIDGKLRDELSKRGFKLVERSDLSKLGPTDFVVFRAEQKTYRDAKLFLVGPNSSIKGLKESRLSEIPYVKSLHIKFLEALEAVGIPRDSLSLTSPLSRAKGSLSFVAMLPQDKFRELQII